MYYVDKVVGIPGDDNLMVEFVQLCNFREVFSMYFSMRKTIWKMMHFHYHHNNCPQRSLYLITVDDERRDSSRPFILNLCLFLVKDVI